LWLNDTGPPLELNIKFSAPSTAVIENTTLLTGELKFKVTLQAVLAEGVTELEPTRSCPGTVVNSGEVTLGKQGVLGFALILLFASPVLAVVIATPLTITLPFAGIVVGELKLCA
jgi:hypothetical protein